MPHNITQIQKEFIHEIHCIPKKLDSLDEMSKFQERHKLPKLTKNLKK